MIQRLLFTAFIYLATVAQSANAAVLPESNHVLLLYNISDLPADIKPVYSTENMALVFGDPTVNPKAQAIFPQESGDYYLLRLRSSETLAGIEDSIPYIIIGQTAIIRTTIDKADRLNGLGWGLTRLSSNIQMKAVGASIEPPVIAEIDTNISNLVSVITPQSSGSYISDLSNISTRYSYATGCRQAEQYVFNKFDSLNLSSSFFSYQYNNTTMRDVVGQRLGIAHPESIIIICAHLDCTSENPNQFAPGAEDNATGVAVVLEAARALRRCQNDLTIRFVAFTGEEQGLIGSSRYADSCQRAGERIAAVINVDMVGYSGLYAQDMHIFSDPGSYALGAFGAQMISTYTSLDTIPHYGVSPEYGSDHYPFSTRGYAAIFFIDAWDGFDWYPYYHTVADTIGNLNLNQQAAIAKAVTAMGATLSRFHPYAGPGYLSGDANSSGDVNGVDVVYMINYLKGGGQAPNPLLRGDANGDCNFNGVDVVYLINFLKGLGRGPIIGNCG
jgi:hypothetical protein